MTTTLLHDVCSLPTAPFVEQRVVDYLRAFVSKRKRLKITSDRFGNLLITLSGKNPRLPRWIFTAHMDHPGFVSEGMTDSKTLRAILRGGVKPEYAVGTKVRFFDGELEIAGVVKEMSTRGKDQPEKIALIRVARPVASGVAGMFDQGTSRTKGTRFYSRVIDDLGGLAAALAMLDQLARAKHHPTSTICLLATRAEEDGFIGAIAASKHPQLLNKTDRLIAIECSAMQPYAPQGEGVILRVGDYTSIFHSGLTYFLRQQAVELQKRDKTFLYQRALMPGGTCEATVYDAYGFLAASLCVPLGNYHNMDTARRKIAPEFIDLNDWRNMVKLFIRIAEQSHEYQPGHRDLKQKIAERFERLKHLL